MSQELFFQVQNQIQNACQNAGRDPKEVKLLLASKTVSIDRILDIHSHGATYFGENKVQELLQKLPFSPPSIQWDFIGHLQTNKVKDIIGKVNYIQSVDRPSLAIEIQKRAEAVGIKQKVLVEVNTSFENSKAGVMIKDFAFFAETLLGLPNIEVCGLMTIATNTEKETEVRRCFQDLRKLRESLAIKMGVKESSLELSMGMSSDFVWAIEEGSTIVRIGSKVFGARS